MAPSTRRSTRRSTRASSARTRAVPTKKKARKPRNMYSGFKPKKGWAVERVALRDLTPERLFTDYVAQRKPLVITGLPDEMAAMRRWPSLEYLRSKAGSSKVDVEVREGAADSYGKGSKVSMPFGELLDKLAEGSSRHYLTTQPVPEDEDGTKALHAEPTTSLAADFPTRPALTGMLVPWQMNLWFGSTPAEGEASSSGLHHDFHDNMYVLLAGSKRFTLFSPGDMTYLPTEGEKARIHSNGLINYRGTVTRPDGAHPASAARARTSRAEARLDAAEKAQAQLKAQTSPAATPEQLAAAAAAAAAAEAQLEAALEATLEVATSEGEGAEEEEEEAEEAGARPSNFCTKRTASAVSKRAKPADCDVAAGEMLYLPAGWFHEVTSRNDGAASDTKCHMAFNYWFHPPTTSDMAAPYDDEHWESVFQALAPASAALAPAATAAAPAAAAAAPNVASGPIKHKGLRTSGKQWKVKAQVRSSALTPHKLNSQKRDKKWKKKQKKRKALKRARELEARLIEDRRQRKIAERERREERAKRRKLNEMKSGTFQIITNVGKIKKMNKRQLRKIRKTSVNADGTIDMVPLYGPMSR